MEDFDDATKSKIKSLKKEYERHLNHHKTIFNIFNKDLRVLEQALNKLISHIEKNPLDLTYQIDGKLFNFEIKKISFFEKIGSRTVMGGCSININDKIYFKNIELDQDYINHPLHFY